MKIRKEEEASGTEVHEVIFASCLLGSPLLFLGSVSGFMLIAGIGILCGYIPAKNSMKKKAKSLRMSEISDEEIDEALRNGQRKITKTTTLRNIHPNQPPLGRLLIGDRLTMKTTYYLEDE